MKKLIFWTLISCCAVSSMATVCEFTDTLGNTDSIDVEYWTGEGENETILVIDWNQSGDYISSSHAFGYCWDGTETTVAEMIAAICANGGLDIDTGYGGAFVNNLSYTDADGDVHLHNETGSWNLGSTGDLYAQWETMNGNWTMLGDWEANQAGIDSEYIADGQLEGINAMYWFDTSQPYQNLDVPFAVPEPATLALLGLGSFVLMRRKKI